MTTMEQGYIDFPERSMVDVLHSFAQGKPDDRSLYCLGMSFNRAYVNGQSDRFAAGLQRAGLGKGSKVGLCLPNGIEYLIASHGTWKAGAVVVNCSPADPAEVLARQVEAGDIDVMVTVDLAALTKNVLPLLEQTRLRKIIVGHFADDLPAPKGQVFPATQYLPFMKDRQGRVVYSDDIVRLSDFLDNDGRFEALKINPVEDLAVLQPTGGTTGTPKLVALTHRQVQVNAAQAYACFPKPGPEDQGRRQKMLAVLPSFHAFAMTVCFNIAVLADMEIITLPRFNVKGTLELIHHQRPDYMAAVPAMLVKIMNAPRLDQYDLSSLRFCISGGAPLPLEVKQEFEEKTGCPVVEGYGLSEAAPVVAVNPLDGPVVARSAGQALPGTMIEIVDQDGCVLLPGERGEICVRGPQVMKGYYKNPEETARVLEDMGDGGFRLHTGDVGILDGNGYLFIVDRIKDLIIVNGHNVYPRDVEDAIYRHPAVEECIVFGLSDLKSGEKVTVWIKLKDGQGLTSAELRAFLTDKVGRMDMPREIAFKEELPKTLIGKLDRKKAKELELAYQEGLELGIEPA